MVAYGERMAKKGKPGQVGNYQLKAGDSVILNVLKPSQITLKLRTDGGIDINIDDLPAELSN
jgi:hypothetical protein